MLCKCFLVEHPNICMIQTAHVQPGQKGKITQAKVVQLHSFERIFRMEHKRDNILEVFEIYMCALLVI